MNKILLGILILVTYLALSANISLYNILFGVAAALVILVMLPVQTRWARAGKLSRAFRALALYLILMVKHTIIGGLQVTGMVLSPKLSLKSGVVAVDPDCDHELGQALSAHAISLSPGELLIETNVDGTMYIHTLNVEQTEKVTREEQKYRRKLLKQIFG